MTDVEAAEYLKKRLDRAREFKTNLVLGLRACELFKRIYKGTIYTLKSADDVRDFKDTHYIESDEMLVFEDLSFMTPEVQASLLKFIEEPVRPLIVLCSKDDISGAMMSRFMNYVKLEYPLKSDFIKVSDFALMVAQAYDKYDRAKKDPTYSPDYTKEELEIINDLPSICLRKCPDYYYKYMYIVYNSPNIRNINDYIQLML